MKFSLFHLSSFFPEYHASEAQFYQEMLEETDRAEAYGFHSVWFAEHHFHNYGGHLPSVPVLGAAVAQRTKNIRIGSGICLLPLQDPIRVAEEYALLDCLSGGRLEFGIGRGFQRMEYDAFERNMADSRALFEEAHDIILKAWREERFSYEGTFRKVQNLRVIPKPVQKPPPMYVACIFTEESFEWTGKMGYNLMVVPYASPDPAFLAGRMNLFRQARKVHGHTTDPEILGVYHFYCGETPEKAREEPREAMLRYVQSVISANQETAYSEQYRMYKALPEAFKGFNYDYLYPNKVIFGDPDQCIERIKQICNSGVTTVSLLINFGGLDHAKIMASFERFAKYVLPKFKYSPEQ
ncbi:MAG TPA: LLM class flavin-dependent oxidoreductase [Methylomirabilota bacterium]|jgi:natural product biosynthesis luciferase-like monooxygenase protein|nr:LLM class flavin-dependent oxidoreductase [Methylomirabilota bacterium]